MPSDDRQVRRSLARQARDLERAAVRADKAYTRAVAHRTRVLTRARTRLPVSGAITVGAAAMPLALGGWHWLWYVCAGFALRVVQDSAVLLRPPPVPDRSGTALGARPPLPPPQSAVFPEVHRLEQARLALDRLLPLVAPTGREAAEEARRAAAEADLALRWQAARLAAVELHRAAPPAGLDTLAEGVLAQERLVAAVADLVEASADPYAGTALQDATDALHGLAQGLRELR